MKTLLEIADNDLHHDPRTPMLNDKYILKRASQILGEKDFD